MMFLPQDMGNLEIPMRYLTYRNSSSRTVRLEVKKDARSWLVRFLDSCPLGAIDKKSRLRAEYEPKYRFTLQI